MSEQVQASHILIMHEESERSSATRTKEEALDECTAIKAELDDGGDFAELARARSDCPSGRDGGDLGTFGRHAMVKEFEDTAFGLEVGDTSDIIDTDFGYHIIRRTG